MSSDLPKALYPARVLLLDDNAMLRCAVRAILEKAGCDVIEGESGRQGLNYLSERENIDLVLSDWMMFDTDGEMLLKEMREREIQVPVLLMTGSMDAEIDAVAKAYQTTVLHKPIRPFELVCKVNEVLEHEVEPGDA